jgi:hypothetical protein
MYSRYDGLVRGSTEERLIKAISSLKPSSEDEFVDKAKILDEVKECIKEIKEQKGDINCS